MVSAEFAAAIPAVLLVLTLALGAVRIGADEVRVVDAARAGARAAARGDDESAVRGMAGRAAPAGSAVDVAREGGDVVVTVTAPAVLDLPLVGPLPAPVARATAAMEGSEGTP